MDDGQPVVTVVKEKDVSQERVVRLFVDIFKTIRIKLKKPRKTKDSKNLLGKKKLVFIDDVEEDVLPEGVAS